MIWNVSFKFLTKYGWFIIKKANLSSLIYNKNVTVEWQKNDRYGRTIGKIIVGDLDANLAQVRAGFAWHYKAYEREHSSTDRASYADAEIVARSKHLGLWQDANATCKGPKGGIYCTTTNGSKKYQHALWHTPECHP